MEGGWGGGGGGVIWWCFIGSISLLFQISGSFLGGGMKGKEDLVAGG